MIKRKEEIKNPRVRLAPSPTGYFHIGTARTALFNYLIAKKYEGKFILRIEDTDLIRSKAEFEKDILDNLKWLGLFWDEGVEVGGPYGPYRQSERKEIYKKYLEKLIKENKAYYCFCSEEELEIKRQEMLSRGEAPRYDGHCRKLTPNEIKNNLRKKKNFVIRLKMPEKDFIFQDLLRGKIKFSGYLIGDWVLSKGWDDPLYNFCVVIDDYEMRITHVIRGEEHLSNTPKQLALYEAFGWTPPKFLHLPLILNPDRSKMSKRFGDVAVKDYRKKGYLPEAMINFLVFLGWHPSEKRGEGIEEVLSLEEIIKLFDWRRIKKTGAIFNIEKLNWLNSEYIKRLSLEELTARVLPYLEEIYGKKIYEQVEFLKKILSVQRERIKLLGEIPQLVSYFFNLPEYPPQLLYWQNITKTELQSHLDFLYNLLSSLKEENFTKKQLEAILMPEADKKGRGNLLWPLRVALSGLPTSASPFEIMEVLGKNETLARLKIAQEKIKN